MNAVLDDFRKTEGHTTIDPPCMGRRHKFAGIYAITHEDGGTYVGSTEDLYHRKNQHRHLLREGKHPNAPLQEAYNSNPNISFEYSLTNGDVARARQLEQELLDKHHGSNAMFNVASDAVASGKGMVRSEETIRKNREAHAGKKLTAEHRYRISNGLMKSDAKHTRPVVIEGSTYESIEEASRNIGMPKSTIRNRIMNESNFNNWKFT